VALLPLPLPPCRAAKCACPSAPACGHVGARGGPTETAAWRGGVASRSPPWQWHLPFPASQKQWQGRLPLPARTPRQLMTRNLLCFTLPLLYASRLDPMLPVLASVYASASRTIAGAAAAVPTAPREGHTFVLADDTGVSGEEPSTGGVTGGVSWGGERAEVQAAVAEMQAVAAVVVVLLLSCLRRCYRLRSPAIPPPARVHAPQPLANRRPTASSSRVCMRTGAMSGRVGRWAAWPASAAPSGDGLRRWWQGRRAAAPRPRIPGPGCRPSDYRSRGMSARAARLHLPLL